MVASHRRKAFNKTKIVEEEATTTKGRQIRAALEGISVGQIKR